MENELKEYMKLIEPSNKQIISAFINFQKHGVRPDNELLRDPNPTKTPMMGSHTIRMYNNDKDEFENMTIEEALRHCVIWE